VLRHELPPTADARRARHRDWAEHGGTATLPQALPPPAIAGALGADTDVIRARWAC